MADSLIALLQEKLSHMQAFEAHTRAQAELLGQEDLAPLLASLQKRQELIDRINAIDERITSCTPAGSPEEAAAYLALRTLLERVMALDSVNMQAVSGLLRDEQTALRQVRQGRRGVNAYAAPPMSSGGMYIDETN